MESPPMTKPVLPPDLAESLDPATILVRGGATRSPHDETCEALFMTSGFVYDTAAAAEQAFAQEGSRYVYSRYRNPTVAMFEERLRLLEGAEACRATASGMAAVFAALLCRLRAGQRVVSSRALVRLLPLHRRRSVAALGHRDRARRRARSRRLGGGARRRRGARFLREPVQPGDGDHRSRRGRAPDSPRRRHSRRRQCLCDAAPAEAAWRWAPTSSSIRRPSTSTARDAVSAARSSPRRNSSRRISARFTGIPARP